MSIQLGVSLGPSFADCCLIDTVRPVQPLAYRRAYTPSESIAGGIHRFLADHPQYKPEKAIIASSLLEKILGTKLGGTVAQVVTRGFENWAFLRQNLQNKYFELQPQRTEALTSQDLIFGVTERVNHLGEVEKSVDVSELDFIISKLKLMQVERVCVNLLFSGKNSVHQKKIRQYFQNAGFEVFSTDTQNAADEILTWRKNLLNASLSGSFKEIRAEIIAGCEGFLSADQIEFLDGDSHQFVEDNSRIASSLFGPARALSDFYKDSPQVLVLGLERWFILKPHLKNSQWMSPWGPLSGDVPDIQDLKVQPTSALFVDESEQLNFSADVLGFEPGPMALGRALKPTVFDLLHLHQTLFHGGDSAENMSEIFPFIQANGIAKFKDTLQAMLRNARHSGNTRLETVIDELLSFMIDQIGLNLLLERENPKSAVTCTGVFAPMLLPHLKKRWAEVYWELCPYSREIDGLSLAQRSGRA